MKLLLILSVFSLATGFIRLPSGMDDPGWKHQSSTDGDLPSPGPGQQQTASLILDVDLDGVQDFIVTERTEVPSVLWYRRNGNGWEKYVVDNTHLRIEAGGDFFDIDGDLDISFGGDASSNRVWWWENPYPNYQCSHSGIIPSGFISTGFSISDKNWKTYCISASDPFIEWDIPIHMATIRG